MKISSLISEGYYNESGISLHKMALEIHSMAEAAWEQEHGDYPNNEEKLIAIKGILSQLHQELKDTVEEYKS